MHLKDQRPPMEDLGRRYHGMERKFREFSVFLSAVELNFFSFLATPLTAEALARKAGTHVVLTQNVLDVLAASGFVEKQQKGYCNTEQANAFLNQEGAYYSPGSCDYLKDDYLVFSHLTEWLINGPQHKEKKKYTYKAETIRTMANTCRLGRLQTMIRLVSGLPEFQSARCLLDIGGAHGLFAIGFCQENPNLSAVIFDQPGVTDMADQFIADYQMENRICTVVGDHGTDDFGHGFDIVYEAFTFYGDAPKLSDYFARIFRALTPGGILISVRGVLNDNRHGPMAVLLWDLKSALNGGERLHHTRSKMEAILKDVGFAKIEFLAERDLVEIDFAVIVARKAG